MSHTRAGMLTAVVSLLAVGVACSGDGSPVAVPAERTTTTLQGTTVISTGPAPGAGEAVLVAEAKGKVIDVRASPQVAAPVAKRIDARRQLSGKVVCVVVQVVGDDWLEVYLPTAPAGHTGWIKRADAKLSRHSFHIEVSRSKHKLTVYAGDIVALSTPVAIGTTDGPPAGGRLFIKYLVEPPDPAGPYGRYAYGLSGSVDDRAAFLAGSGVVAIHGTNDPSRLGHDVPTGSIAVGPDIINRLVGTIGLPLGTPVDITN